MSSLQPHPTTAVPDDPQPKRDADDGGADAVLPERIVGSPESHDWSLTHGAEILRSLRYMIDHGDPGTAATALADTWAWLPDLADETYCMDLYRLGVRLVETMPTSLMLASAFRQGARALRRRGAMRFATASGTQELAIHRQRDDDPEATAAALADLARTYQARSLYFEVRNCLDETLETYLRHRHPSGTARTLVELGALTLAFDWLDDAVYHLRRADRIFRDAPDASRHAECLAVLSRALRLRGDDRAADRQLNRALAAVVGADRATGQRVRDLAAGAVVLHKRPTRPSWAVYWAPDDRLGENPNSRSVEPKVCVCLLLGHDFAGQELGGQASGYFWCSRTPDRPVPEIGAATSDGPDRQPRPC